MNKHVRVYLLHAYMHSGNFARGWGQGPIFLFSRGFQLFSGEGGSNCYFIKKGVDFPGWVVRTSCPLWTCAQPIYMCLCIKPLKCSRQYFFLKIKAFIVFKKYYVTKIIILLHSFLEVPLVTTKTALRWLYRDRNFTMVLSHHRKLRCVRVSGHNR